MVSPQALCSDSSMCFLNQNSLEGEILSAPPDVGRLGCWSRLYFGKISLCSNLLCKTSENLTCCVQTLGHILKNSLVCSADYFPSVQKAMWCQASLSVLSNTEILHNRIVNLGFNLETMLCM